MTAKLLPLIPQHHTYCEPFCGGASLFFAKEPSPVEILNDLNSDIVNLYRVLRDPQAFEEFRRLVELTPYSREEWSRNRYEFKNLPDGVEKAWAYFTANRQSFGGNTTHGWGYAVRVSARGMAQTTSKYLSAIDRLPQIHERLRMAQIDHDDFRAVIKRFDTPETFFYCDPPYVLSTRVGGKEYDHEMTEQDHQELEDILIGIQGMTMVSGYRNEIYDQLEAAGFVRQDWKVKTTVTKPKDGKLPKRTESVWLCPETQRRLGLDVRQTGLLE